MSTAVLAPEAITPRLSTVKSRAVYGLTIFCGAFLLFQVQLLLGKYILPWFGGSPAVWTTCMLFFQLLLLGGYFYSHVISSRLSPRGQALTHISVLALSVAVIAAGALFWKTPLLPGISWRPVSSDSPVLQILAILAVSVGLPYLCLSTTGPLLQSWFSRTQTGQSPYRLYALSNAGSLLGLLTYPFLFEPQFRLHTQAWLWCAGYLVFFAGTLACARGLKSSVGINVGTVTEQPVLAPSRTVQLFWFLLPAMASLMLLATTNLMCQEVAVVPFLWVLPLALYLISFIICFDNPRWYHRGIFQAMLGVALPMAVLVLLSESLAPVRRQVFMLSVVLFACCMVCHGELVRLKPHPAFLTRFYLLVSAGGAAGGIFVALVAPHIFTGFWEFHFGLIGCVLLAILALAQDRESWWYRAKPYTSGLILLGLLLAPELVSRYTALVEISVVMYQLRYYLVLTVVTLAVGALIFLTRNRPIRYRRLNSAQFASVALLAALSAALFQQVQFDKNRQVRRDRNFYAALMIHKGTELNSLDLRHGQISHGFQSWLHPKEPTLYYARQSGIGLLLAAQHNAAGPSPRYYGMIGLGVGTLAAYGRPGDTIRYYEINPQVIDYSQGAHPYFTFVRDSQAHIEMVPGDARLSLEREFTQNGPQRFDVFVIDAFNSDSIPVHLLTQEAIQVYLEHLKGPDSVLAFHISNKVLDLRPVLATLAAANRLAVLRLHKARSNDPGELSDWVLLAKNPAALDLPVFRDHLAPMPAPDPNLLWTDDYSNLFRVLRAR